MKIVKTKFKGLYVFEGQTFKDQRGFLRECFRKKIIKRNLVFSIVSKSKKNVLRGLHLQVHKPQEKFLTVLKGKILDVAVDLRRSSKTFGKHFKIILSEKNCRSVYVPPGFAHGFCALAKENYVIYGCTNYRDKNSESGIKYNDIDLNIKWPTNKPKLSDDEDDDLASIWMERVAEASATIFLERVKSIRRLSEPGAAQLAADLEYFSNVVTALTSRPQRGLLAYMQCASVDADDYARFARETVEQQQQQQSAENADSLSEAFIDHRIVKQVAAMRGIAL